MKTMTQTRPVTSMTDDQKLRLLKGYSAKARHLLGDRGVEIAGAFDEAIKPENFKLTRKAAMDLAERLKDKQKDREDYNEAQSEFQGIVVVSVENFLYAASNYVGFFQAGTLGDEDYPFIENNEHFEVQIAMVGQDGGAPRWQAQRGHSKDLITPYFLSTQELEYPLLDIYSGKVADRSKIGLDMAGDLNMQLDGRLFGYIQDLIGPFVLTGDKNARVYVPHSRINTANLPTTNLLTPADNTGTSLFRKSCLDVIIAYAKSWGDTTFGDGPLVPKAVFVPSSHITGFLNDCKIDDPENELNRQVFDFGMIMDYGGYRWMFVADPTLDPADGLAYVQFNKTIGFHWTKPLGDKTFIDDSIALHKENRETMQMQKCFFTALPAAKRVNVAAVKYRN